MPERVHHKAVPRLQRLITKYAHRTTDDPPMGCIHDAEDDAALHHLRLDLIILGIMLESTAAIHDQQYLDLHQL